MNFFDKANKAIRGVEASVVNLLSAIAPWGAPISPAYMTYYHMIDGRLNYPIWVAVITAAVVEILGLSTVNTALGFFEHNKRNKAQKNRAPVWVATASFIFYLLVILTSNVILDAFSPGIIFAKDWPVILVRALFALLSVPAVLIMAVRTQHQDLLAEIEEEEEEKRERRKEAREQKEREREAILDSMTRREKLGALGWRKASKQFGEEDKLFILNNTTKDISAEFGLTKRTSLNWKEYCENNFAEEFDKNDIESYDETKESESYGENR